VLYGRCSAFRDDLELPFHPHHGDRHAAVGAAGKVQVSAALSHPEPVHLKLLEEIWQDWLDDAQSMRQRLRHQTEGNRRPKGDGSGRPCLRVAGNGIAHGNTIVRFTEASKHLW
jgi:hypothetical protein